MPQNKKIAEIPWAMRHFHQSFRVLTISPLLISKEKYVYKLNDNQQVGIPFQHPNLLNLLESSDKNCKRILMDSRGLLNLASLFNW
jgi:hypothetical protein